MAEPPALEPDYRFTLASERTFLAYERTAIGLLVAGVGVLHFFGDGAMQLLLVVWLLAAGGIASIGGYVRYRKVDAAVRRGEPLPSNLTAHLLAGAVISCLVVAVAYLVWLRA